MIIDKPGKVTDNILLLGRKESNVYLLNGGDECAILGGGMVHIVPDILDQIKSFGIAEEKIKRIVVLHSHFDHCGIVPFFKNRLPQAKVTASQKSKELMMVPKYIEAVESMNRLSLLKYGKQNIAQELGLTFTGIDVEAVAGDGDTFSCGNLSMEFINVPGHSSCSIAVYVPEEKAMFASDAAGIPFGNEVFTAANSDFDNYQESLNKIAAYDIDVILCEHYGARTGSDSRKYIEQSIISAKETRKIMEESLSRTKDLKKSTEELTEKFMARAPKDFLPRDVISLVISQMLKYIGKKMNA